MKPAAIALLLFASLCCVQDCCAQDAANFQPATTNVWGAEYPRVNGEGRVQLRQKLPTLAKSK
jgi:hypothetical protein